MCSFDIKSLFTNIPLEETIDVCLDCLHRDDEIGKPTVPENLLRKLLIKATTEVEFSYDGIMYRQKDGVAMGLPLRPVLANIFIDYCESLKINGLAFTLDLSMIPFSFFQIKETLRIYQWILLKTWVMGILSTGEGESGSVIWSESDLAQ